MGPSVEPNAGIRRVPYRIELRFTSRLGDPYRIMSGPAETYRQVRFNERLRSRLERYVIAKSDPGSPEVATLAVALDSLSTTYDQIGEVTEPGRVRVALLGSLARVVPSSYGQRSILHASEDLLEEEDHDSSLPQEITKGARLALTVEVRAGQKGESQSLVAEASHTWERDWDASIWAYDYSGVLDAVAERAVAEVDAVVDRVLGPR